MLIQRGPTAAGEEEEEQGPGPAEAVTVAEPVTAEAAATEVARVTGAEWVTEPVLVSVTATLTTQFQSHGTRSAAAGHKGASHHGHALSARSRSSHLTAARHAHANHLNRALAHDRLARFSTARQVTITPDVDTPAENSLPPGIELNVDRGKLPDPETVVPDDDGE